MAEPTQNTTVVAEGISLLTQMYQSQPNVKAILTAILSVRQNLENVLYQVLTLRRLASAIPNATPPYNSVFDQIGALVGQPRNGLSDANYQSILFVKVAANRSAARPVDWSAIAGILLRTSGGPVTYTEGVAAFMLFVGNMTLNPNVVAQVLTGAVGNGIGAQLGYSTWADGNDFEWADSANLSTTGQGTFGDSVAGLVGGLLVSVNDLFAPASPSLALPSIAGLSLWLKADTGVTVVSGSVSSWNDQSGNGNNASQATPAKRPGFSSTGGRFGGPCLTFDGASQFLNGAPIPCTPSNCTIFLVSQYTGPLASAPQSNVLIMGATTGTVGGVGVANPGALSARALVIAGTGYETDTGGTPLTNNYETWTATFSSVPLQTLRVNGAARTLSANNNAYIANASVFSIGSFLSDTWNTGFVGNLEEIIVYNSVLSQSQIGQVEAYLRAKYATW